MTTNLLTDGDILYLSEQDKGNSAAHNLQAVGIKIINGILQVTGHMPTKISSICLIFLRRGGSITLTRDFTIDV